MELTEKLEFDHDDREDIYEYVESHGASRAKQVRKSLNMGERAFGHHAAILKRDGVLEEVNGKLRIAFEAGTEEEFEAEALEFTIRQAREEDLTGLVGAIRQAIGGGAYVDAETVADVVDSEVVGWVHLKHPESAKLGHTAELTVGVLEEYRGNSIGSHLLERGLEWARSEGFERIYNSIPSTNETAIDFLESRGWEVEAVRAGHYKLNGDYIDEVMMARRL